MRKKTVGLRDRACSKASDFVFQLGVSGWSMDDLATEIGVTKRTLYKFVSSKENVVEQVVIRFIQSVQDRIADCIASEPDYYAAMMKVIEIFPLLLDRLTSRTMQEIFLEYPNIEREVYNRREELTDRLIDFFRSGIEKGYLKSNLQPELVLQMYQAFVLYFIRFAPSDGDDHPARIGKAFHSLLYGIVSERAPRK